MEGLAGTLRRDRVRELEYDARYDRVGSGGLDLLILNGAPGVIRTPDLLVRSQSLYPAELRAHAAVFNWHYSGSRPAEARGASPPRTSGARRHRRAEPGADRPERRQQDVVPCRGGSPRRR